jgi:hypothetical protein
MYHDDAVLEFPYSGERFVGVENLREWRSSHPASTTVEFREIRGRRERNIFVFTPPRPSPRPVEAARPRHTARNLMSAPVRTRTVA